jgi:hypothetical protein
LQLVYFAVGLLMLAFAVVVEPTQVRATAHHLHLA